MPSPLTAHETRIVAALAAVLEAANTTLVVAAPGSPRQLGHARILRDRVDQLVRTLREEAVLDAERAKMVAAALAPDAQRHPLGRVLFEAGWLAQP